MDDLFLSLSLTPIDKSIYLTAGFVTFFVYLLFCLFKSGYKVSTVNLLKSFPVGCGVIFGLEIIALAYDNTCQLSNSQSMALCLGGLGIIVFAFNALKVFIDKSENMPDA